MFDNIHPYNYVCSCVYVVAHNVHEKASCAPPNQNKATLCTTKVYVCTELHYEP